MRSYMSFGAAAVARSRVLRAGVPHHALCGVRVARRRSLSASMIRCSGLDWLR